MIVGTFYKKYKGRGFIEKKVVATSEEPSQITKEVIAATWKHTRTFTKDTVASTDKHSCSKGLTTPVTCDWMPPGTPLRGGRGHGL